MSHRIRILSLIITLGSVFAFAVSPARAEALDLGSYQGKVVYLDFWASWCTLCRASFPWMNQLQQSYGQQGLVIVAVNLDHNRELAERFLERSPSLLKILFDPQGEIASQFDVQDMPTSVLIGRDGAIRYVHSGFHPEREGTYLSHITTLLHEQAP